MKDYKQEAKDMAAAKLKKLGGKRSEHTESFMKRADGGRICKADGGPLGDEFDSGEEMDGEMSKPRLDKPGRGGGKTTVNIIVGKGPDAPGAPMAAMPPPPAPMPPPANLPPPPGGPMGGMPMRAKGGRVHTDAAQDKKLIAKMIDDNDKKRAAGGRMTAGAESGEGRLEKAAMARRHKD